MKIKMKVKVKVKVKMKCGGEIWYWNVNSKTSERSLQL